MDEHDTTVVEARELGIELATRGEHVIRVRGARREVAMAEAVATTGLDADTVFDAVVRGAGTPPAGHEVIARPGEPLRARVRAGDRLVRVAPGEPGLGIVTTLREDGVSTRPWLAARGIAAEEGPAGGYAVVEHAGGPLARRVTDVDGFVAPGNLLLRERAAGAATEGEDAEQAATTVAKIGLFQPMVGGIWAVLHEPERDDWLTQGMPQAGAIWHGSTPNVTELGPAHGGGARPAIAGATRIRPLERGLVVRGWADSWVTDVRVTVRNASGAVPLRASADAPPLATHATATFGVAAAGATTRLFEAVVYLDDPPARFGPLTIVAETHGVMPGARATAEVLLVGVQLALVDDRLAHANGQQAGPVPGEPDEKIVFDFLQSPQPNVAALTRQARTRQMVTYQLAYRQRALSAAIATAVGMPEMPLWMAELQLVGVDLATLERHLAGRVSRSLTIDAQFALALSWDGPSSADADAIRRYSYQHPMQARVRAQLELDLITLRLAGVDGQGRVPGAIAPAPAAATFPVAGRRIPTVRVNGATRRWGRSGQGALLPAVVVEWQPLVTDAAGREIIRGGDGRLELRSLSLDGLAVDPGRVPGPMGPVPPPADTPIAALPRFRVLGKDQPAAESERIIRLLVEEYVNAHAADAWVAVLPLAIWQETVVRIYRHESHGRLQHFDHRSSGRYTFRRQVHGQEHLMPFFGAPGGYGVAQLDPIRADDPCWSPVDNIREGIRRLIEDNAHGSYRAMHTHFANPPSRRDQAAYRRDAVRRYNGTREMRWNGNDWEIHPTTAPMQDGNPNPRLQYCNNVLGTAVQYFTIVNGQPHFNWPLPFRDPADYGAGF